jgi:hypothetical protein
MAAVSPTNVDPQSYRVARSGGDRAVSRPRRTNREVAALPQAVAPQWVTSVSDAMAVAHGEVDRGFCTHDPRGVVSWHPDARRRVRAAHASVRLTALYVCSLWSRDPVPVTVIEVAARSMCPAVGALARRGRLLAGGTAPQNCPRPGSKFAIANKAR